MTGGAARLEDRGVKRSNLETGAPDDLPVSQGAHQPVARPDEPRSREPRPTEGDECDRELPHGGPRRACCAARENTACGPAVIPSKSCPNPHCPKCQGAAG